MGPLLGVQTPPSVDRDERSKAAKLHGVITRYGRKVVPEDIGQVIGGILIAALAEILRLGKLTLRRAMGSGVAVMIALVSISVSDISLANDGGVYFGGGQSRFVG